MLIGVIRFSGAFVAGSREEACLTGVGDSRRGFVQGFWVFRDVRSLGFREETGSELVLSEDPQLLILTPNPQPKPQP